MNGENQNKQTENGFHQMKLLRIRNIQGNLRKYFQSKGQFDNTLFFVDEGYDIFFH